MRRILLAVAAGVSTAALVLFGRARRQARAEAARQDECVNVASDDSFPASDPPSSTPVSGAVVRRRGIPSE